MTEPVSQLTKDAMPKAMIVPIMEEEGQAGLFYATSPSFPTLLVAAPTRDELHDEIPQVLEEMFRALGKEVVVYPAERQPGLEGTPWVAVPGPKAGSRAVA